MDFNKWFNLSEKYSLKMGKKFEEDLTKEGIQMVYKHLKIYSTPYVIRELVN